MKLKNASRRYLKSVLLHLASTRIVFCARLRSLGLTDDGAFMM